MKTILLQSLLIISIITISITSCTQKKVVVKEHQTTDCKDVHWTYEGEHSPEHWKDLCSGFVACGGQSQSPIDIVGADVDVNLKPIDFQYVKTSTEIVNNGHTIQFNVSQGSKIFTNGKEYQLLQFHFHALSEHTVNGNHFPVEVHYVHKNSDSDYAVIGIMYEEGEANELFTKYLANFPHEKGKYTSTDSINLSQLLPENKSYFTYSGSLTTPPCSEIVSWYVLKNSVSASKEQILDFSKILHNNYRPVMPLNKREIKIYQD